MKILVAVKRVVDYKTSIRIKPNGMEIETTNVKMSMNPFDEIAIEEAVRFKEKGWAKEIVVITIGNEVCQETLRHALAMGADRGVLIKTEAEIQPLAAANILKSLVKEESPQLIILGKQAIDTDNNQVGQMLAGLLNWPQGTFASKLVYENNGLTVTREIDGGLETLFLNLPAVITTDLRLNEPRYLTLPNIVQAKRKQIDIISVESLRVDIAPRLKTINIAAPEKRRKGVKVENAAELVKRLHGEAHVI